jgi:hypothetical protein
MDVLIVLSPFYLESCIWSDAISRWIRQRNSECASNFMQMLGKSTMDILAIIRQAFGEESLSRIRKAQTYRDRKKGGRWRVEWSACSSFSLTSKGFFSQGIRTGRPNSQLRILLWSFTVIAWKCANTSPRNLKTKELAVTSRQRTASHFVFHQGMFDQKEHDCLPPPSLLVSTTPIEG